MKQKRMIIVGAGIAGLATAEEALRRGYDVLVVERSSTWGGLTRSFEVNGCLLDFGSHLLFLQNPEVKARVLELIDQVQWVKIVRRGKLYIDGCYVEWPLRLRSVLQLPFPVTLRVLQDQFFRRRNGVVVSPMSSYEEELLAIYGKSLYNCLFGPLTRKFLKEDPRRIHPDWAYASIRAATKVSDQAFLDHHQFTTEGDSQTSQQEFNLLRYVVNSLRTNLQAESFYYFKDGFGVLPNSFAKSVRRRGGTILLEATVQHLVVKNNQVIRCLIQGREESCDALVWTGSLQPLAEMLKISFPSFHYLHTKFVYVFLKKCLMSFQVCYYADPSVSFNRGTLLSNYSPTFLKNCAYTDVLCLEYTYRDIKEMQTHHPEANLHTIRELQRLGFIRDATDIADWHCENVPYTYPILDIFYRDKLEDLHRQLAPYRNVHLIGRQGSFNYDNSDLIIKQTLHHPMFEAKVHSST